MKVQAVAASGSLLLLSPESGTAPRRGRHPVDGRAGEPPGSRSSQPGRQPSHTSQPLNRSAHVLPSVDTDHVAMSPGPPGDATLPKLGPMARVMEEGTLALDDERCVTYVNPAGETMLRWPLEDLLDRSRSEALQPVTADAGVLARHAAVESDELEALATVSAIREALADDRLVPVSYTHLTLPTICSV